MPDFERDLIDSLDGVADSLTPELQIHAIESGWPEEVASKLRVTNVGGILKTEYDGDDAEYQSWELGDQNRLPNPVLHSFFQSRGGKSLLREHSAGSMEVVNSYLQRLFQ